MTGTSDAADPDVAAFYAATYGRLVMVVGAVAQDRDVAEEAVQDAFVRLLGQWERVAAYDDPEAWVRKVAFGFVSKRQRKHRNGARALLRLSPQATDAPSETALDLQAGLASLPRAQREVIVLQHLGLGVADIAQQLGVPAGTVKSRLARGRAALAECLREDEGQHATD